MEKIELIVGSDGQARHVYSEEATQLDKALGAPQVRRASFVEPFAELSNYAQVRLLQRLGWRPVDVDPTSWFADMLPSGGDVLGPFPTRDEALRVEVAWLREHNIPLP